MMKPEDWVKARIGDVAHVPTITHKHMDAVVHVFDTVVASTSSIDIPLVGKWPIIWLLGDQLVRQGMEPGSY